VELARIGGHAVAEILAVELTPGAVHAKDAEAEAADYEARAEIAGQNADLCRRPRKSRQEHAVLESQPLGEGTLYAPAPGFLSPIAGPETSRRRPGSYGPGIDVAALEVRGG
jgi:hypothetical protein